MRASSISSPSRRSFCRLARKKKFGLQGQPAEVGHPRRLPGQAGVDGMLVAHDLPEGIGEGHAESVDAEAEASARVVQLRVEAVDQGLVGLQGIAQRPDVRDDEARRPLAARDLVAHSAAAALDVIPVLVAVGDRDLRPAVRTA